MDGLGGRSGLFIYLLINLFCTTMFAALDVLNWLLIREFGVSFIDHCGSGQIAVVFYF